MRRLSWTRVVAASTLCLLSIRCNDTDSGRPAGPSEETAAATTVPVEGPVVTEAFELRVGPHVARMPPAKLKLLGDANDGLVVLSADTGEPLADGINAMFFQMTLQTDSDRPWTYGLWRYQLSGGETETTDGIYLGAPENHLRPLDVEVEVVRVLLPGSEVPSRRVRVRLAGRFVSAEAADPLNAPVVEVSGSFEAAAEGP